ncbi:MAG: hypothetical protein JWR12_1128 [Mucilaginibacter sp.]|nr:hypothetical protein [Mucilaginibacter sp.]
MKFGVTVTSYSNLTTDIIYNKNNIGYKTIFQ